MTQKIALCLCLLFSLAAVYSQDAETNDECFAQSVVVAKNSKVVADAIGDAVTSVQGAVVQCENGTILDGDGTTGIAVAVSLAVSTTNDAMKKCSIESSASTTAVSLVKRWVAGAMELAFSLGYRVLGEREIWKARGEVVKEEVLESDESNLSDEVSAAIVNAVNEVLYEISCGCGGQETEPCSYNLETREFFGHCTDTVAPECSSTSEPYKKSSFDSDPESDFESFAEEQFDESFDILVPETSPAFAPEIIAPVESPVFAPTESPSSNPWWHLWDNN